MEVTTVIPVSSVRTFLEDLLALMSVQLGLRGSRMARAWVRINYREFQTQIANKMFAIIIARI